MLFFFLPTLTAQEILRHEKSGKKAFKNAAGQIVLPLEYDDIKVQDTLIIAKKSDRTGIFNLNGKPLLPFDYRQVICTFMELDLKHQGFAVVGNNDFPNKLWGIYRLGHKLVLSPAYEYARALQPNLLVARYPNDTLLQFFNADGKLLYKLPGQKVERGFNAETYAVFSLGMEKTFHWLDGKKVFPDNVVRPVWTDGEYTICGDWEKVGVQDKAGKKVLPFKFVTVAPGLPGQFIAKAEDGRLAVYDQKGKAVIPPGLQDIEVLGAGYMVRREDENYTGVYDRTGKQVLEHRYVLQEIPINSLQAIYQESKPEQYRIMVDPEKNLKGFYRTDGTVVLPPANYQDIAYLSDMHPILTFETGHPNISGTLARAFDLTGRELFVPQFSYLAHTGNPNILAAACVKKICTGADFIDLSKPIDPSGFRFSDLKKISGIYYYGVKSFKYTLFDARFQAFHSGEYHQIKEPDVFHIQLFKTIPGAKGQLVAVAQTTDMPDGHWIGINEQGKTFFYKPTAPAGTKN